MKKIIFRLVTAAATASIAGGALVAGGHPALAATAQHRDTAAVSHATGKPNTASPTKADTSHQHHTDGKPRYLSDGHRNWRGDRDSKGHWYWYATDHGRQLRYDGHRLYYRVSGIWVFIPLAQEFKFGFNQGHFDRLVRTHSV